jgi:hypothetical protein
MKRLRILIAMTWLALVPAVAVSAEGMNGTTDASWPKP